MDYLPDLMNLPVMLSASLPSKLIGTNRAQDNYDVIVTLVGGILSSGGTLVFGGHPSITPLVHRVALSSGIDEPRIILFQDSRFKETAPDEVKDQKVFKEVRWVGSRGKSKRHPAQHLGDMRQQMIRASLAGVFVGGKTEGNVGRIPGIRDEFRRFMKYHPNGPAYLLGLLEGETLSIIREMEKKGDREPNSLNDDEARVLHYTDNIDLACSLILADLARSIQRKLSQ